MKKICKEYKDFSNPEANFKVMMDIRMNVKAKITGKIFEHNKIYNGKNKIQKEKDGSEENLEEN